MSSRPRRGFPGWLAWVALLIALMVLAMVLGACHVGEGRSLTFGANLLRDPHTGELYPSIGGQLVPHVKHDAAQWQQAFGRRTADIEQLATLRQELRAAREARSHAEAATSTARADLARETVAQAETLARVELERDEWQERAESDWWLKAWREFRATEWGPWSVLAGALALAAYVTVTLVRRRRRAKGEGPKV